FDLLSQGKVRDMYALDASRLLIVTTDRMSAFDVILPDPIPGKGIVLNQLTLFWMERFADLLPNHTLSADVSAYPDSVAAYAEQLRGRSVLARRAKPLPIECIVRGYLSGSGWKDYQRTGTVCGHTLPEGLQESQKLPQPIFTPSTKAAMGGHDENITRAQARELIGETVFAQVEALSLQMYARARDYASERGIIIADTKFEFGLIEDQLVLIDEVLTPDSSRFWAQDQYTLGQSQPSFDKQFLRDWLTQSGWDKQPPAPNLPVDVIAQTKEKYHQAYTLLTGATLDLP
ncbi:MAG: phosphoribosylaminoimidazolesuccinocarboxamide synthase, partial [Thermodesulfobacteriota bacterium]